MSDSDSVFTPTPKPRQAAKLGNHINPTLATAADEPGIFHMHEQMNESKSTQLSGSTKTQLLEEIRRLQEENLQLAQEKQQQQQQKQQRRHQSDLDDCKSFCSHLKTFPNFEVNGPYVQNTPGMSNLNSGFNSVNSVIADSFKNVHDYSNSNSHLPVPTNSIFDADNLNTPHDIHNYCNNKSDLLLEEKDIITTTPKHVIFENPNTHNLNKNNNDVIMPSTFNSLAASQRHANSPKDIERIECQIQELLRWKRAFTSPQHLTFGPSQQHFSRRDIKRDNFRPINSNDLASSLNYFELELSLHKLESDSDKLRAAALVFPQTLVEGYHRLYPDVSNWKYSEFRNYILNKLPQHYNCHLQHNFSSTPSLLDLDNIASKDTACPKEELYKFFMVYRAPAWARDQMRNHVRLDISQFKEKVDDILTSGGHGSSHKPFAHRGFNTGHPHVMTAKSSFCTYHRRFGRNALTCIGPACPMYSANLRISSRPQPPHEQNNQGND